MTVICDACRKNSYPRHFWGGICPLYHHESLLFLQEGFSQWGSPGGFPETGHASWTPQAPKGNHSRRLHSHEKDKRCLKFAMTAIHAGLWLSNVSELCISPFNGCDNGRTEISKCNWQKAAKDALEKLINSSWGPTPPPSPYFYPLYVHPVLWPNRKRILLIQFLRAILNLNHYNVMYFKRFLFSFP